VLQIDLLKMTLKSISVKTVKYFFIFFGVVLIVSAGFYLWRNYAWKMGINTSCVSIGEHKVVGVSMEPLLKDGSRVKGLTGYYACNEIKRGEIAILKFKTREETFVKNIAGIPGDSLEFADNQLKLNGQILKNIQGEPYLFSATSQRVITIPVKDGKIPEGRYLILGEEKGPNAFDSRQFGFTEKEHLIGRVTK